ncbi:MAG: mandelate racemase/muconate lactonizing enzyme family protein [Chloroflexota bacterium]|nr:mandelate racemase/muconate lactonizing enzyme family protein [Chloroflexota bacterium]
MKITALETIHLAEFANVLWVRIYTDEGLIGLGETFFGAHTVAAYIHETVAPYLLGKDPLRIDHHARQLYGYLGFNSTGAEARGNSAVDLALWDLFGKAVNQPVYQLLGGASRERIRIYNTCAGYRYIRSRSAQAVDNWGLATDEVIGPYEDLEAFLHRADELAHGLLDQGISGMKIWPFDLYAEASGGHDISSADLRTALEPFRKIRRAVGDAMDIMVEFHSLWDLPTARKITAALEEFNPYWFEDPIKMDNLAALAELARSTRVPITASETLGTRWSFRELFERRAVGVVMLDVSWCGGLSEARKIAAMAEAYQLPVAPHDCTGPVVLMASVHLSMNATNALIQETVRAFYRGWYTELVTQLPRIENGQVYLPEGVGLCTELQPGLERRPDATVKTSSL